MKLKCPGCGKLDTLLIKTTFGEEIIGRSPDGKRLIVPYAYVEKPYQKWDDGVTCKGCKKKLTRAEVEALPVDPR